MQPDKSAYPAEWLRIAEKDLERVGRCLAGGDAELAGFCLQQALEKFLKAFLLSKGWTLRRIHDLEALLDDAIVYDQDLGRFRSVCQQVTNYYTVNRYPLPAASGPTEVEILRALHTATELVGHLRRAFP
jgi:HEPN domain-containing protein